MGFQEQTRVFFAPRLEKVYSRLTHPRPVELEVGLTPARFHAY